MARPRKDADATPAAEEAAKELGVDLSKVEGSGAEGRVKKEDVMEAAEVDAPAEVEAAPSNPERDAYYRRMGLNV